MDCSHAQDLISAAIDGQASAEDRRALDEHVVACPACAEQLTAERELDGDLRRLFAGRRQAAARLAERVAQRIAEPSDTAMAAAAQAMGGSDLPAAIQTKYADALTGPYQKATPARRASEQQASPPSLALRASVPAEAFLPKPGSRRISLWQATSWLAAMAAGFLIAVLVFQPWKKPGLPGEPHRTAQQDDGNKAAESGTEVHPGAKRSHEGSQSVEPPVARLVVATGDVAIRPAPEADWSATPSHASATCGSGASVRTPPGVRCELQTADGCVIRVNDDSELTVRTPRSLELHKGQVWCSAPDDVAMEVYASVPAESSPCTKNTVPLESLIWTFRCPSNSSLISHVGEKGDIRLTAARGEVELRAGDSKRRLPPGDTVTIRDGQFTLLPHQEDALLAATWIDALLVKKGHTDPELLARVNGLLAEIGHAKASMLYEQELRGLGEHCVLPLLRYVQSPLSSDERRERQKAMRIVADLAPPWAVGDLIPLLDDGDAEVRVQTAAALRRLTGQDHGRQPDAWKNPRADCTPTFALWQTWWRNNERRYPIPEFAKAVPVPKQGVTKKT